MSTALSRRTSLAPSDCSHRVMLWYKCQMGVESAGAGTTGAFSYNSQGQPTGVAWTAGVTTITTDTVARSQSGRVVANTIDAAASPSWVYTYDTVGRLTGAAGSGHDYQYGYNPAGGCGPSLAAGKNSNRTSLTDNGATIATYCYDQADRLTSTTQPGYTGTIGYIVGTLMLTPVFGLTFGRWAALIMPLIGLGLAFQLGNYLRAAGRHVPLFDSR